MLETMRNASKGWLAAILILLLVASFGIWGVQDMINMTTNPVLATVGDREVTPEELQSEFNRYLRELSRQSETQLSAAQAKALNLDREALDRLLTRLALSQKAEDVGLSVSLRQVVDSLSTIPGLSDGAGGINGQALQQLLQNADMDQEQFMDMVRGDMLREQLIRSILAGVDMPPGLNEALNRYRLERRVVEYVLIDPARAGEINDPGDATLSKFYADNAATRYSIPELRTVTVVMARPADVAAQIQVSEEEIKRVYEANRRRYETPEKRTLEQIRFKTEQKARDARKKLDAGQTFEAVAQAEGFKPDEIKLGEVSKSDPTIPAVAFEVALNTPSEPVKGPFGWVIVRALDSTPGTLKTLDDVRQEIRDRFVQERSKDKLFDLTNDFEDTRGGGATLEEAAKKHNLPVVTATVDARGNDAEGGTVEGLLGGDFLQKVFAAEQGVDSELSQTSDGVYFEFRVDKVAPAAKKPFDSVRAQVLEDWRNAELEKRLKAQADALVKRGVGGESMAAIASSLGVAPLKSEPLPRYGQAGVFGPATLTTAGNAKVGQFFSGPVRDGKSIVVARLAEIQYAPEEPNSPFRTAYSSNLRQSFASDLAQQFANGVRAELGVTIDEKRFQTFHAGE